MKSLIIVCIMGLISIFDCKVDGNQRRIEVLGPELIDQVRWCENGLAWYEYNGNVHWTGNGVKLNCEGNQAGAIGKAGFLGPRGSYFRVVIDVSYVSGWLEIWGGGQIEDGRKYSGGGYDFQVNYGGHFEFDLYSGDNLGTWRIDSSMFVGDITSLSIKKVTYYFVDD